MGLPVAFGFEVVCSVKTVASCSLTLIAALLAACGNQASSSAPDLDAAFVAAEADKGNLTPMKQLARACHLEVVRLGRRGEVCAVSDRVSQLRKPTSIRFDSTKSWEPEDGRQHH